MLKKVLPVLLVLLMPLMFTACYDAVEINNYAYVSILGIDSGVTDRLRLTFNIPKFPEKGGGEQDEEQAEKENIVIDAPSLLSGVALINSSIPKILNFMHLKAIVVSEELASSGNMGDSVIPLIRHRQIRRNSYVFFCKGSAQELITSSKPYLGELVTESIEELVSRSEYTGLFPKVTFSQMYNTLKSPYSQLMGTYVALNNGGNLVKEGPPYEGEYQTPGDFYAGDTPKKGGQSIELLGSAVFNGDKMVGKLTGFETQMALLVRGELKRTTFTIEDPQKPGLLIPIETKEFSRPKIKVDIKGDKPKIEINIAMEGEISAIQSRINYEDPDMKKIVEKTFSKYVEAGIEKVFAKCKVLKSDVFGFGSALVPQFWTIQEWENYSWNKRFSESELKVNVNFIIRRTGKLLNSAPIISSEGKK